MDEGRRPGAIPTAPDTVAGEALGQRPGPDDYVLLGLPDVNGSIRGKAFRQPAFAAALRDGTVMTDLVLALDPLDAPITDYDAFGIRSGAGDLIVTPDPATVHPLTWRRGWWVSLGTASWPDGTPCELLPREVLRAALDRMSALGYSVKAAFEYEIRIRAADGQPASSGVSYSLADVVRYEAFVERLTSALDALGVGLSAVHTEAAPGLLELNVEPRIGLRAADDAVLLKFAVKAVAASLGQRASFLAKQAAGEEGSSGHIHLSCWRGQRNAFAPAGGTGRPDDPPSPLAGAVAGILAHLPAASLLLNPTINSYKRVVPGFFAPVNVSWGIENRSAAVRVIRTSQPERARLECRRPGADANPYLALAALVVAAADGIERGLAPPAPVVGDAYGRADLPALPDSLDAALRAFEADAPFRTQLGESFSRYYAVSRAWELKAWQLAVTDWERERYEGAV